jgi:hypothetical protein
MQEDLKESAVAKSSGQQQEKDMSVQDSTLLEVLRSKRKISKNDAFYKEQEQNKITEGSNQSCKKCKFNLGDEKKCHIVEGEINNENGISKYFSAKGDGMLPGDIVWESVKKAQMKLGYEEGYVINHGAEGFQCKDCKYYLYSHNCLLIKGIFDPEMSCGFIVKIGNGMQI